MGGVVQLGQDGRFITDSPAAMVGTDEDVGPKSTSETWFVIEVIMAMVMISVGKADLRPVALLTVSCD